MTTRVVHFLVHVPKCAGSTVEAHFGRFLGDGFLLAPRWENPLRQIIGNRYPSLSAERLSGVRAVSGHSLSQRLGRHFAGAEIRQSVLLRDPVGYFLSLYNYRWVRFEAGLGREPPEFDAWYRSQRRDPISRFLLNRYFDEAIPALYRLSSAARLAKLESHLASFHFVGSYRRADEMIREVSADLGIPAGAERRNTTAVPHLHPDELGDARRRRLLADNELDSALYNRWADRGWAGQPGTDAPDLPRADQLTRMLSDTFTGALKSLGR